MYLTPDTWYLRYLTPGTWYLRYLIAYTWYLMAATKCETARDSWQERDSYHAANGTRCTIEVKSFGLQ